MTAGRVIAGMVVAGPVVDSMVVDVLHVEVASVEAGAQVLGGTGPGVDRSAFLGAGEGPGQQPIRWDDELA